MARRYVKKGRVGHLHFVHLIYTPPPHKPGRQEVAADVTCMCLGKDAQLADDDGAGVQMTQIQAGQPLETETTLVPVGQPFPTCAVLLLAPKEQLDATALDRHRVAY